MSAGPAGVRCLPQRAAALCQFCCLSPVGMSQLWSRSHLAEQRRAELIRLLPGKVSSLRQNIRSTLALHPCAARREVESGHSHTSKVCISSQPPKRRTSCKAVDTGQKGDSVQCWESVLWYCIRADRVLSSCYPGQGHS